MGTIKLTGWIKPVLVVLFVVTFVVGCSNQDMQTASSEQAPSVATEPSSDAVVTLAAGDALGQRLFIGNTQPSGPAVAAVN